MIVDQLSRLERVLFEISITLVTLSSREASTHLAFHHPSGSFPRLLFDHPQWDTTENTKARKEKFTDSFDSTDVKTRQGIDIEDDETPVPLFGSK